jgi:ATP-dependent Clp protease protease subunit
MNSQLNSQLPPPAYVTFVGPMQYPATKNFRNILSQLAGNGTPEIYLQFSSSGGALVEGFALFNFLRSLPVRLTIHNIGSVESIANIVFLAADQRFACPDTHFLIHGFEWTFGAQQSLVHERIKEISKSLEADEERFVGILKSRTGLKQTELDDLDFFRKSAIVNAQDAKKYGIVQDVKQASIPRGSQVWNVDF